MKHDDLELELGGARLAAQHLEDICGLYDSAFSQPPFHWNDDESAMHRDRLSKLLKDPSFGVVLASRGQTLVGFGYGFTLASNTQRWTHLNQPLPPEAATEWPGRTFMLFDFAVESQERHRGIGHRIHHMLLGSRTEERATLTVQPTASATKAIYEHWGWHLVGQIEGGPGAAAPVFDVYLRDRLNDLRAS